MLRMWWRGLRMRTKNPDSDAVGSPGNAMKLPPARPVEAPMAVYTQVTSTRWQGDWLPQLVYHIWFDERPKAHFLDLYGGRLDGLTWRVTLDRDGEPLLYESVDPCGCYLKWHPVEDRLRALSGDGKLRCLFRGDGLVEGTQRLERFLLRGLRCCLS